eukprot:596694-Amphidinium_carterae.1
MSRHVRRHVWSRISAHDNKLISGLGKGSFSPLLECDGPNTDTNEPQATVVRRVLTSITQHNLK